MKPDGIYQKSASSTQFSDHHGRRFNSQTCNKTQLKLVFISYMAYSYSDPANSRFFIAQAENR